MNNRIFKPNKKIVDFSEVECGIATLDEQHIYSLLSRLICPLRENHNTLKNILSRPAIYGYPEDKHKNNIFGDKIYYNFCKDENKFNIYENGKSVAMVYTNSKENIPKWIETYGYNICTENKMDRNHMFSFGIDILLFDLLSKGSNAIKCRYKIINHEKHATCIYIYGKALVDGGWKRGYFEYFLNDKNVLFHRLFRPTKQTVPPSCEV